MNKKKIFLLGILIWGGLNAYSQDSYLDFFKKNLSDNMTELKKETTPAYYMSYLAIDKYSNKIVSSFGSISKTTNTRRFTLLPQIRVGDKHFDNFAASDMGASETSSGYPVAVIPIESVGLELAAGDAIKRHVNLRYKKAIEYLNLAKIKKGTEVASSDKADWFSDVPVANHYEAPLSDDLLKIDVDEWKDRLKAISALFKDYSYLTHGAVTLSYDVERRYFVSSEGTEVVQNMPYARIMVSAATKADDGMVLPLHLSYFAYKLSELPTNEVIIADTKVLAHKLGQLRVAPLADTYTGPAILSGATSGVFFHEIFGHRIEGQRMKREHDGKTFTNMVDDYVLPKSMSVSDDPTLTEYQNQILSGYYKYDDQGVKAERVSVVKDGKINNFLMTRTPIDGHPRSNGHARVDQSGKDPVSRQSNLIIETNDYKSDAELRAILIAELKKQGKEFGYFIKEVTGGMTFTSNRSINSFNVNPLEVYKIFVDGKEDLLVRGADMIGTPLSMFSNIQYAGGQSQVFTGVCGAESGFVPVTAISPSIFVNNIEIQRKVKSNEVKILLSDPTKK